MSKHTEGPWKLEYHNDRFTGDVLAPNGSEVCTTWNHSQHGEMFDKEVNARLIAAAPELYEVLRDAREAALEHRAGDVFGILLGDVCSEAVEKAEGRQS